MGCGGSKNETTSPRRKPQGGGANGTVGGTGGAGGPGKANTRRGKGKNRMNNNDEDAYNENTNRNQGPIYEQGWKKRLRENLRNAAAGEEIEPLEKAMEQFINNRLEDGGDLTEAQRRLDFLQTRKYIRDACMRQHPVILDKAIQRVENSPYRRILKPYLDRAYYLKQHQEELDSFRHDIMQMSQPTISEIRSYNHPNGAVHHVMAATYLCLGYPESHLLEWTNIQNLMGRYGKESLLYEVSRADTNDLDEETTVKVKKWLNKHTMEEVRVESSAAACFYVWASRMVGKYEGDKKGTPAGQPQPKQLTNSRMPNTPTNAEKNQSQFKARPAPMGQSVKDTSQTQNKNQAKPDQKQAKAQQNQTKQAKKSAAKPSPKTSANDAKRKANTTTKDAKQTTQNNVRDSKTQAKSKANDVSSKPKDPWATSAPRKAW